MPIFYEDKHVICDDQAITIKHYYFPFGSKRIPYVTLKNVKEQPMNFLSGSLRIWGMGLASGWLHLDWERPQKNKCIVLDTGELIKAVITPTQHDEVLEILQQRMEKG